MKKKFPRFSTELLQKLKDKKQIVRIEPFSPNGKIETEFYFYIIIETKFKKNPPLKYEFTKHNPHIIVNPNKPMLDIDLYRQFKCLDCSNTYLLSGSTAICLIICPKCKSANFEYIRNNIKPLK